MLVLSRKKNESIVIGPEGLGFEIVIVVVEIRGDKVRLGVDAPREVPVHRREVYETIKANLAKANADAGFEANCPEVAATAAAEPAEAG